MFLKKKVMPAESGKTSEKSKFFSVKNATFMLVIALLICFISALGSSLVKSGGGSITVKQLQWETPSGHMQSAQLFIPTNATKGTPAPAVVVVHGWNSAKEVMTPNYVELSRRGYVVLDIDMYGHGDSDDITKDTWFDDDNNANGVYDGVKMLATLPFVDTSKIGILGHSNGAYSCNVAVMLDNKAPKQLISSVFLESNDAFYTEAGLYAKFYNASDKNFTNVYGNRNVGIVADKYDECFFRVLYPDGTLTAPRDYINQPVAQSFLNFGKDPTGLAKRTNDTMYTENINGKDAIRVVYTPTLIHAWAFMSSKVTSECVEFFQKSFPAPNPIVSGNQIYQVKIFFETIGLIGFFMFLVNFILVMLKTKFFGVLKTDRPMQLREVDRKGKSWLWWGLSLSALFSAISFLIVWILGQVFEPAFFNQNQPWVLGIWSLVNGLFTLLILILNYRRYAKPNGLNLYEQGVFMSKDKLGKSILLGVLAAVCTYSLVFLSNYFFTTDFRFWEIAVRPFTADKIPDILKFMLLFVAFYVINSIAMNVFNYIKIGKKEWVNTLVMCIFNVLGVLILFIIFYGCFLTTGLLPTDHFAWGVGTLVMWAYPVVFLLPIGTVINRIIYKQTRNPYISSIAFALIVTTMTCTFTLSWL